MRGAKITQIYEGTNEIQKLVISGSLSGDKKHARRRLAVTLCILYSDNGEEASTVVFLSTLLSRMSLPSGQADSSPILRLERHGNALLFLPKALYFTGAMSASPSAWAVSFYCQMPFPRLKNTIWPRRAPCAAAAVCGIKKALPGREGLSVPDFPDYDRKLPNGPYSGPE